ncbi:MAG: hypothetical protein N2Z80_04590 [Hydrogenothermaceae bacterium]|nr:hypothetical protein [Hydrogenothermaceae bacterium]
MIYSGGDDILAILPKSKTIETYRDIISEFKISTISGGIVFAHYKIPLSYVLQILRENEKKQRTKVKMVLHIIYKTFSSSGCFVKNIYLE